MPVPGYVSFAGALGQDGDVAIPVPTVVDAVHHGVDQEQAETSGVALVQRGFGVGFRHLPGIVLAAVVDDGDDERIAIPADDDLDTVSLVVVVSVGKRCWSEARRAPG